MLLFYLVDDLAIQSCLIFDSELFFTKVFPYSRDTALHSPGLNLSFLDLFLLVCAHLSFFPSLVEELLQMALLFLELVLNLSQSIVIVLQLKLNVHSIDFALKPPDLVGILDIELVSIFFVLSARFKILCVLPLLVLLNFKKLGFHLIDDNQQIRPQLFVGRLYLPGFVRHLDFFDDVPGDW